MYVNDLLCEMVQINAIKKISITASTLASLNITAAITNHHGTAEINLPFIGKVKQKAGLRLAALTGCF